jgi:hypothetical protein
MRITRNFMRMQHERVSVTVDEYAQHISITLSNGMQQGDYELPFNSIEEMEVKEHEIMTALAMRKFVLVHTEEA